MNKTINIAMDVASLNGYEHILEFGVFSGATLSQMYEKNAGNNQLFGFDSFRGLPEDWHGTNLTKGAFDLGGIVPSHLLELDNVTIYSGWFEDTIGEYLKVAKNISLLHIDCDLYSSTKSILYSDIRKFLVKGTVIVFDEWYYNFNPSDCGHEQKLFFEWVEDFGIKYKIFDEIEQERRIVVLR